MSRISSGRSLLSQTRSRPAKKRGPRNHALGALAIAEKTTTERNKIRRGRLGEIEDDGTRQKSHNESEDEDGERASKRRKSENVEEDADGRNSGSDSEGNKWHVGIDSSDEDSDLDSDNALGASDEERFEAFAFRGSTSASTQKSRRRNIFGQSGIKKEIDLSEDDEKASASQGSDDDQGDDGLGEDAVDLATALDFNMEEDAEDQRQKQNRTSTKNPTPLANGLVGLDSGMSESDESGGEETGGDSGIDESHESGLDFSDDDEELADTTRLVKFVEGLNNPLVESVPKRRGPSYLPDRPSEFGMKSSRKLTLADLQTTVKDPNLMKSLKMLHNSEKAAPQAYKGGVPGKLEPPLAKRQQDRLDRAAAYGESKDTLSRWVDTVKQNRRAEHISFPLPNPDAQSAPGTKELMPTTHSQPLTSLEATIQKIMQESGFASGKGQSADGQIQAFEELQERKMPIEEVQARRAELRKARELLFQEELRGRRIKKIKSKAYRRVHRKEREKMAKEEHAALEAAGLLNSDEERERNDRRRAKERMGARHRESKWAKGVRASGRAAWDEEARTSVTNLARRDEELRRRIEGNKIRKSEGSESESLSSESEDDLTSLGSDGSARQRLREMVRHLDTAGKSGMPQSKLAGMAFMQRAEASRRAANDSAIEQLHEDLEGDGKGPVRVPLPESAGRLKFGSQKKPEENSEVTKTARTEFEERLSEDEEMIGRQPSAESEMVELQVEARPGLSPHSVHRKKGPRAPKPETSRNPWIDGSPKSRKDDAKEKSFVRIEPVAERLFQKNEHEVSDQSRSPLVVTSDETSSSGSGDEGSGLPSEGQRRLTRNEEMVKMMFAGDDVFEDFDKEKHETIEDEGDQAIDNTLPGWGNWTGAGISKREQKRSKGRYITTTKGVQEDKRKDAKLDKVIVNEKRVKKVRVHSNFMLPLTWLTECQIYGVGASAPLRIEAAIRTISTASSWA